MTQLPLAPTDSPTEAADMQAAAAAALLAIASGGKKFREDRSRSNLFTAPGYKTSRLLSRPALFGQLGGIQVDIWVIAARADFSADFSERFVRQSHPANG